MMLVEGVSYKSLGLASELLLGRYSIPETLNASSLLAKRNFVPSHSI